MATVLVTGSYLEGVDALNGSRFDRAIKWLEYYLPLKETLGFDKIFLIDNKSSHYKILALKMGFPEIEFVTFETLLTKESKPCTDPNYSYMYGWRILWWLRNLVSDYDKIISMDNDCFILSQKLADFVKNCNSGYHTLWSNHWDFPLNELSILCKDAYPTFLEYTKGPYELKNGTTMEKDQPFTHIHKEFIGDRYSNWGEEPPADCDFLPQCEVERKVKFTRSIKDVERWK